MYVDSFWTRRHWIECPHCGRSLHATWLGTDDLIVLGGCYGFLWLYCGAAGKTCVGVDDELIIVADNPANIARLATSVLSGHVTR